MNKNSFALRPPMGWNSYDYYDTNVSEADVLANAALFNRANETVYYDVGKYLVHERFGSASSITKEKKKISDSALAAEKMLAIYVDTPAENAALERVMSTQLGLYRWYVMNEMSNSKSKRQELSRKIDSVLRSYSAVSPRQRLNYMLMRYMPATYRLAYKIYDRIRVPDWDVK